MTTRLRSLRVTADMDASGYARGAQQKVAADGQMIASGDRFGASLATSDIALQKLPAGMARLSRMWISGYSEAEKFEKAVRQVGNALDKGTNADRAVAMLKAIETQFGRTANAAQLAKQGFVSVGSPLATAHVDQSGINQWAGINLGRQSAEKSAHSMTAAFAEEARALAAEEQAIARVTSEMARRNTAASVQEQSLERLTAKHRGLEPAMEAYQQTLAELNVLTVTGRINQDQYAAALGRAQQALQNAGPRAATVVDQTQFNRSYNIGPDPSGGQAKQSAAVFQAAAAEQEIMAASAKRLIAEIEPLTAAQDRLNSELLEYRTLLNGGAISQDQYGKAVDMSNARFIQMADNIRRTGQHTRLARHEMANLSYQLNDIAVMTASGQAPFMMLMQQGMQIGQLFGGKTLMQAIKGVGIGIASFITNPINLAVLGFAALVGGAVYAYKHMGSGLMTIEELLKRQKTLLDDLKESYGEIGLEVGKMAARSASVVQFEVGINLEQSRQRIQDDLTSILKDITPKWAAGKGFAVLTNPEFKPFLEPIKEINSALKAGNADVQKFREEIVAIASGPGADEKLKKVAAEVLNLTDEIERFQRSTDQLSLSLDPLASKLSNLFAMKPQDLLGKEPGYSDIQSFIPDTRSQIEKLDEAHNAFNRLFGDTQFASLETMKYEQALAALNAELDKTIRLSDLEIQAIYAKSPAQKAALAAERERINAINTGIKGDELAIRSQQAYALALQGATYAINEQNRARLNAANDNIATAQLELRLVGESAAVQAEQRANLSAYLDLKKQAEANGLAFDEAQYDLLKKKNAEIGLYTELTARQKLADDLDNERIGRGLSSRDSSVRQRLLSSGIAEGTQAWSDFADEITRALEAQDGFMAGAKSGFEQITADASDFASSTKDIITDLYGGMEDALVQFVKTGKVDFASLIDTMIEDLVRLSYKMAMSGLLNALGGGALSGSGGSGGLLGGLLGGLVGGLGKQPSLYADGGVFTNRIVTRPTMFGYGGKMGVMGEKGPEAVVPLSRTADGRLGIASASPGGKTNDNRPNQNTSIVVNISTPDVAGFRRSQGQVAAMLSQTVARGQRNL